MEAVGALVARGTPGALHPLLEDVDVPIEQVKARGDAPELILNLQDLLLGPDGLRLGDRLVLRDLLRELVELQVDRDRVGAHGLAGLVVDALDDVLDVGDLPLDDHKVVVEVPFELHLQAVQLHEVVVEILDELLRAACERLHVVLKLRHRGVQVGLGHEVLDRRVDAEVAIQGLEFRDRALHNVQPPGDAALEVGDVLLGVLELLKDEPEDVIAAAAELGRLAEVGVARGRRHVGNLRPVAALGHHRRQALR